MMCCLKKKKSAWSPFYQSRVHTLAPFIECTDCDHSKGRQCVLSVNVLQLKCRACSLYWDVTIAAKKRLFLLCDEILNYPKVQY